MHTLYRTALAIILVIILSLFFSLSYANAAEINNVNTGELVADISLDGTPDDQELAKDETRNNFDIASLLSLLGIGLLKFFDDKFKVKFKGKFKTYQTILVISAVAFGILEVAIVVCYIGKLGAPSFGNLKNLFLGLIPVVFCFLTLLTEKNDNNPTVLSQNALERRINEFTAAGMAPLGMLVGDMDFFGKVYNNDGSRRRHARDDIACNSQIKAIANNNIDRIEIVCKHPTTKEARRRIGYLLEEFEGQFSIRFFDESKFPIPKMRGRIMYRQTEQVVVITKKIRKPDKYEYSEYPVSSLTGGLFADLWHTVWNCSTEDTGILEQCKTAYTTYTGKKKVNEKEGVQ